MRTVHRVAVKPEDLAQCWVEAFNAGDVDGLVALYEPQGAIVEPTTGQLHAGSAAIRTLLGNLVAMQARMTVDSASCVANGDLCLGRVRWSLKGMGPDGKPFAMDGRSMEVYRRQPDGAWLYALDHPTGAD
ncbi:DUF4440 domain-containing protein [bacterium]|nr:MAG: DUF4440 domain-containing protein [bacterium]